MRKQEIMLFLYRTTKCPREAEKIDLIIDFGGQNETKYNWISFL